VGNHEDASDLTQAFFATFLEKHYLRAVDANLGKFRTFLLLTLKRFLANDWDRQHAQKRGGFTPIVSIDQQQAESRFAAEPSHTLQPDVLYDRQWALILLDRAMTRLREEYVATARTRLFEALGNLLVKDESSLPYAEVAAEIAVGEITAAFGKPRSEDAWSGWEDLSYLIPEAPGGQVRRYLLRFDLNLLQIIEEYGSDPAGKLE
jgi:DNA-directed RNA polymerase specialized sigma24 family protein